MIPTPSLAPPSDHSQPLAQEDPTQALAARLQLERKQRGWSLDELAERAGVSKAMISKIERSETSPTAVLLGKLAGAFGLTLSTLLARAEQQSGRLLKRADQPFWQDPETGFIRRQLAPNSDLPLELTQVELPPEATVDYPQAVFTYIRQLLWITEGTLLFTEGQETHRLDAGDCLQLDSPQDCRFHNPGPAVCRYVVAVLKL
ncbi:helix-turn-helix domain-containing protein [Pokkaliibacter sp. CJK22405]|uniref:helix-turn-helix domain-containing protein n=1 Tax=Pokkaliibacter sp. CJK22405 TaxID=3384615 RepID=UPI003984AB83